MFFLRRWPFEISYPRMKGIWIFSSFFLFVGVLLQGQITEIHSHKDGWPHGFAFENCMKHLYQSFSFFLLHDSIWTVWGFYCLGFVLHLETCFAVFSLLYHFGLHCPRRKEIDDYGQQIGLVTPFFVFHFSFGLWLVLFLSHQHHYHHRRISNIPS